MCPRLRPGFSDGRILDSLENHGGNIRLRLGRPSHKAIQVQSLHILEEKRALPLAQLRFFPGHLEVP